MTRDQKEAAIGKDLEAFRKQYPSVNSGNLQTFILGWNAGFESQTTPSELLGKDDDKFSNEIWAAANDIVVLPENCLRDFNSIVSVLKKHFNPTL